MTRVLIEAVYSAEIECDTAASHSVISVKLCENLQDKLNRKLFVKKETVAIKLADGSISNKLCGSVQLNVRASRATEDMTLSFFVVSRPNNLLGRNALEKLWPKE